MEQELPYPKWSAVAAEEREWRGERLALSAPPASGVLPLAWIRMLAQVAEDMPAGTVIRWRGGSPFVTAYWREA
jgi:hypothetical protein